MEETNRGRSCQHPSSVSALRAGPPSLTRGEGKALIRPATELIINSPPVAAAGDSLSSNGRGPDNGRRPP
ncbi:MAG: hypothetical protein EOQ27_22725 [Mesorhizobium sp.]|nr:MAG: hypothetical protein EOQ27_22725 [Mesorhizobium sp.]